VKLGILNLIKLLKIFQPLDQHDFTKYGNVHENDHVYVN